jgi:shikimate dehydrogenase
VPLTKFPAINAATRLCAVFGSPIRHSASPAMHNAAFAELGLNWRYLAFEVDPKNLRAAIDGARAMNFAGINLTVPHKLLAMKMVDKLDVSAKVWGAVNTIRFEGRTGKSRWLPIGQFEKELPVEIRSVGFNTDADGLADSLREDLGIKLSGKKVLLLGAGGAGQAAALKLAAEKVGIIYLVNRTFAKVLELQKEIAADFPSAYICPDYPRDLENKIDLVINATSLGLKSDDELPFDKKQFSLTQAGAVYDMIYRPAETQLLAAAKKSGCKTANGLGMLLHQGAKAFEIWTGKPAPLAVMRRALEENIYGAKS